jgi:hypothetical protein
MTSRDTEPHVSARPEAIWLSGFAVVTARLPGGRLGWAAVCRLPCGCTSYIGSDSDMDAIHDMMFRGRGGEFWIDNIRPLDPT